MEACVIVLNVNKSKKRKNKILFINGVGEIMRDSAFSWLSEKNIEKLVECFNYPSQNAILANLVDIDDIKKNEYNLSIQLYVESKYSVNEININRIIESWKVLRVKSKGICKEISSQTVANFKLSFGDEL